jgi:DNA-binding transcriptional LysR family regulator
MQHADKILVFVKVAEFDSINKAARALGVPISSVSRKLSALESDLGVSLVSQTTRRVIPTSQGRVQLRYVQCQELREGLGSGPRTAPGIRQTLTPIFRTW